MKISFPPPERADENGIIWVGGDLSFDNVISAYKQGIFPWPHQGLPLLWFCPQERGVLKFSDFRIPRSTQKELRRSDFRVTFDTCFSKVMQECALQKRSGQRGTWITEEMKEVYGEMFRKGYAHSVECWRGNDLVGGLYGVYVNGVFSGESMFYRQSGASKQCVISLVHRLTEMGLEWFDIQMVTPILETFGGTYVLQEEYLRMLHISQQKNRPWRIYENLS